MITPSNFAAAPVIARYDIARERLTVIPRSVDRCDVLFDWYAPESLPELRWRELVRFGDEIQAEDAAICERVQHNLRSRAYRPGPYSPLREAGVYHFHGLMGAALK